MNSDGKGPDGLPSDGAVNVIEGKQNAQGATFGQGYLVLDDLEKDKAETEQQQSATKRRPSRPARALIFLLLLAGMGIGLWLLSGDKKTKIIVPVRENNQRTDQAAAPNSDDSTITAQAIAEIRSATATPTPALSASPAPTPGATFISTTPITVPPGGTGGTVLTPAAAAGGQTASSAGASSAIKHGEIASQRNPERSIRCAPTPLPISARQPLAGAPGNQPALVPATLRRIEPVIPLPPFGAMLPVRTLGALYTLRQSLARFELTRDLRGQGWEMKRGTVLIGQLQGSESDRAYLNLMGFIDPTSGKLVRLSGDLLGADGAPGLKGKRHKVSSTWKRVLDRAATSGVALGQAALSRGNSTTVILPGAVAPEINSLTSTNRREFVEVQAGSAAYILINRLPEQAQGVDAPIAPEPPAIDPITASENGNDKALSDEELAALIESGSPDQIRAALPRMSPGLRQIAEIALKESGK